MAKENKAAVARLFIAVGLSPTVRQQVAQQIQELRSLAPQVKWVSVSQLHFTLAFLGAIALDRLPAIVAAATETAVATHSFFIRLGNLGVFPTPRNPHVIWMDVIQGNQPLVDLQQRLAQALQQRKFSLEQRPFVPHLTLGRIRPDEHRPINLPAFHQQVQDTDLTSVSEILVMRSDLKPSGAEYTVLATIAFPSETQDSEAIKPVDKNP